MKSDKTQARVSGTLDPIVRTFSVTFTLTGDQIADLGRHLKMRQVEESSGMDTVQIEDRVCMAVFKAACANARLDRTRRGQGDAMTTPTTPAAPSGTVGAVVGISAWMPRDDGRPDKFEAREDGYYHFPCCSCKHASTKESEFCRGCVHYVL